MRRLLLSLLACSDSTHDGGPVPAQLRLLSNPAPVGTAGWPLADPVVIEVLDAAGESLAGVVVSWSGVGQVSPATVTTDDNGRAAAEWTLGLVEGNQAMSITTGALPAVTVIATAQVFHAETVTVGGGFACALTAARRAYCWGENNYGQLGLGTTTRELVVVPQPVSGDLTFSAMTARAPVLTPTPVATGLRFTGISAEGISSSENSVCAVTAQGEVWCWGDNFSGELGDGTRVDSPVPVRVQSDVTFSGVETGYFHACALAETGALWCWGEQESDGGGLGPRPKGFYSTPVSVADGYRFKDLSLGRDWNLRPHLREQDVLLGDQLVRRAWCRGSPVGRTAPSFWRIVVRLALCG